MDFTAAIMLGNTLAKNLVKHMVQNPMLIGTAPYMSVPLEVVQYSQSAQAEVSEHPIIVPGTGEKNYYYDNVAPSAWTWQLSGYIPGLTLEVINYFQPSARYQADCLRRAFRTGQTLTFKDMDCKPYKNVVIQSLTLKSDADCRNKIPFTMTIKEIVELNSALSPLTLIQQMASPEGSIFDSGVTQAEEIADSLKTKLATAVDAGKSWLQF